jgi:hypothetical protein
MKNQQSFKARAVGVPVHPVSPAELRRQVVEYRGKVSTIGAKLQAAVWAR